MTITVIILLLLMAALTVYSGILVLAQSLTMRHLREHSVPPPSEDDIIRYFQEMLFGK